MRVVYISEITGKPGIWLVKKLLPEIQKRYNPDFIIANANSATASSGLGKRHAGYLRKMGINCITLGDNAFRKPDLVQSLNEINYVLRPVNLSSKSPGRGIKLFSTHCFNDECKVAVISALGVFGAHRIKADNPFVNLEAILEEILEKTSFVFVDFASFSSAEKQTMGFFLDGKVSACLGSGTKVATTDARVSEKGTAFVTDAGRTGSFMSVGGFLPANKIREYKTGLPEFMEDCWEGLTLQGFYVDVDESGKAKNIKRILIEKNAELGNSRESN
ncbi:MAG: metallophosphoesterase [Treponema sp.]|nr:MAG: metallophosphoesterase [Treponema sp.]